MKLYRVRSGLCSQLGSGLLLCACLSLMVTLGCAPRGERIISRERLWQTEDEYNFSYEDRRVQWVFQVGDREFRWYVKNKTRRTIILRPDRWTLHLETDPRAYALWGERKPESFSLEPIYLKPQGFVTFSYPVRMRSPFYPFRPGVTGDYWVECAVERGKKRWFYRLGFPTPKP